MLCPGKQQQFEYARAYYVYLQSDTANYLPSVNKAVLVMFVDTVHGSFGQHSHCLLFRKNTFHF